MELVNEKRLISHRFMSYIAEFLESLELSSHCVPSDNSLELFSHCSILFTFFCKTNLLIKV